MIHLNLSFENVAQMHAELASLVDILRPVPAAASASAAIEQRAERIAAETLPAVEAPKAPKPVRQAKTAVAETPSEKAPETPIEKSTETPAPTQPAPKTATSPTTESAASAPALASPSEPAPAKAITLEEVRAKLAALSQAGKAAQVKDLIAQTGAAKLTDVPADKYPELLEKADAL